MRNFILLSIILSSSLYGQEMVNNGDFESYSACPDNAGQLSRADNWFTFGLSPEYFNACADHDNLLVPSNSSGYQEAASGNAYAGFIPIFGAGGYYREFLGTELVAPLTIGETYNIQFKVSLGLNDDDLVGRACSHLGAKLSTFPYSEFAAPAVDNFAHIVDVSVITETEEWVIISGTIVADSAYQYLIIGNFFSELIYDTTNVGTNPYNRVYYYVEDVSVYNPGHVEIAEEISSYRLNYNAQNKQVSIFYQGSFDESIKKLEVYSVTGQLISTINSLNSNHVIIDCSTYVPGVYFVRSLDANNHYEQLKFIVS